MKVKSSLIFLLVLSLSLVVFGCGNPEQNQSVEDDQTVQADEGIEMNGGELRVYSDLPLGIDERR